jgi:hypothetical protein
VRGGLFLRKRPLKRTDFPLQQLENRYNGQGAVACLKSGTSGDAHFVLNEVRLAEILVAGLRLAFNFPNIKMLVVARRGHFYLSLAGSAVQRSADIFL